MLAADTDTPVVAETTMSSDLLQALEILTELVVQKVREDLGGLTCKTKNIKNKLTIKIDGCDQILYSR